MNDRSKSTSLARTPTGRPSPPGRSDPPRWRVCGCPRQGAGPHRTWHMVPSAPGDRGDGLEESPSSRLELAVFLLTRRKAVTRRDGKGHVRSRHAGVWGRRGRGPACVREPPPRPPRGLGACDGSSPVRSTAGDSSCHCRGSKGIPRVPRRTPSNEGAPAACPLLTSQLPHPHGGPRKSRSRWEVRVHARWDGPKPAKRDAPTTPSAAAPGLSSFSPLLSRR